MNCKGRVIHTGEYPVANARVQLLNREGSDVVSLTRSDAEGYYTLADVPEEGSYQVQAEAFGVSRKVDVPRVGKGQDCEIPPINLDFGLQITFLVEARGRLEQVTVATAEYRLIARAESKVRDAQNQSYEWIINPEVEERRSSGKEIVAIVPRTAHHLEFTVIMTENVPEFDAPASTFTSSRLPVMPAEAQLVRGEVGIKGRVALEDPVGVRLQRATSDPTLDQSLWVAIRNRGKAMSFGRYQDFMNRALRFEERAYRVPEGVSNPRVEERIQRDLDTLGTDLHGVRAYQTLKALTETFLLLECGVRISPNGHKVPFDADEETYRLGRPFTIEKLEERLKAYLGHREQLPYITRVVKAAFPEMDQGEWGDKVIGAQINEPCLIELIWSYWMEEGMLVQTMNAVSQRFQNVRGSERDPLLNLEIDPLRPLNNLLWGYVQDEFNRLSVRRRAYEYAHQYGLTLYGKATAGLRPADNRSKFLEAFHNLMYQASVFFKEDFQTTVIADGFPLLNSLKEVHLILAQGLQNQCGDLPWTARAEMLLMQYMLARREIRDFLQSRAMVPYKEPWEAQVDTMKGLQGWTDVTVTHFRDLAVYGEQILLSIRYGDWINVNDENSAKNWARYFRPEIQGYLHSYRAVTGVDLTNPDAVDATIPGILLQKRMAAQQRIR